MRQYYIKIVGLLLFVGFVGCGSNSPTMPEPESTPQVDHATGDLVVDLPNGAKMAFMWIEPGTFMMGSPETEQGGSASERPQHQVTLTKGFYLGKYEVTQWQWQQVMGSQPWRSLVDSSGVDDPVFNISWEDAERFIEQLNALSTTHVFRFPTEAEWEYACRAGTATRWSFGDEENQLKDYAWYDQNSNMQQPHRVGLKLPNLWGLYDMHGNVWEMMSDWWGLYSPDSQIDPTGPPIPPPNPSRPDNPNAPRYYVKVARGGDFIASDIVIRSANRRFIEAFPYISLGFRVVSDVKR